MLKVTIKSLLNSSRVISTEALSVNRTSAPLLTKLASFVEGASTYVREQLSTITPLRHDMNFTKINRNIDNFSYLDARSWQVTVPAGLSVTWLEYIAVLRDSQAFVTNLYDDTLRPFSLFLGACINDPERTQQLINNHSVTLTDLQPLRDRLNESLRNGSKGKASYGDCIKRNSDWSLIKDETNKLIAAQKKIPQDLIIETVNEVDEKLTLLTQKMADTNQKYRPTPELINDLANLTYMLAEKVTFFAVYSTYYSEFTVAMDRAVDDVNKKI